MALKNLSNSVMVAQGDRFAQQDMVALLQKDELLLNFALRIKRDTDAMRGLIVSEGGKEEQLKAFIEQLAAKDSSNDATFGAFDDAARAALVLCDDDALRAAIKVAHGKVLAAGRQAIVVGQYAGAAGEASGIQSRLDAQDWAALKRAKIGDTTLEAALNKWIKGAEALTALDNQRAALAIKPDASRVTSGDVVRLRNQWVRTMNGFVALVRSSDLAPDDQDLLLSSLLQAEGRADEAVTHRAGAST